MSLYLAATLSLLALTASAANDTCYKRSANAIQPIMNGMFACSGTSTNGGAELCCLNGSECGPDSICHRLHGDAEDRWYVGGCTDESYNDPICRQSCTSDKQQWIQWDSGKSAWSCCGNTGCDEDTVTDESFKAVSPSQWRQIGDESSSDDGGLSMGAKIGIGVGVGVALLALIGGFIFFFWFGTKKSRKNHSGIKGSYAQIPVPYAGGGEAAEPLRSMRGASPGPRSRNVSPEPPRSRHASPPPGGIDVPRPLMLGQDGPRAPDSVSMFSRPE